MSGISSPLQLGPILLHNRNVISVLMKNRALLTTVPNDTMLEYYKQHAEGAGLIVSKGTLITYQGSEWEHTPGIWNDEHVAAWKNITDVVHEAGSHMFTQLWHFIMILTPEILPTEIPDPRIIVAQYKHAAMKAKEAGFDGVELHAANGYLVHQFLDNTSNKRTDEWGGSVENRSQFLFEVVKALIEVWGADRVGVKLNAPGGYNDTHWRHTHAIKGLDEMRVAYVTLVRYVAAYDISFDGKLRATQHDVVESYGSLFKNSKFFLNGGLTPSEADQLILEGKIDAAVFGIPWIGHPDLQRRIEQGKVLDAVLDFKHLWYVPGVALRSVQKTLYIEVGHKYDGIMLGVTISWLHNLPLVTENGLGDNKLYTTPARQFKGFGERKKQPSAQNGNTGALVFVSNPRSTTPFCLGVLLIANNLPECAQIRIFVTAKGPVVPQPPYTMFAYEGSSITTVQTLGSDPQNLLWTVDHPAGEYHVNHAPLSADVIPGATLLLSMADANGNAGGVGPNLLTVTGTGNTTCHAQNPTSPVSVTTNTTRTLESCAFLPLLIKGGTRPYTITVVRLGQPVVANVTLDPQFDTYNWGRLSYYIYRNGVYAASTNLLTTLGTADLNCGGLQSVASDSTSHISSTQGQSGTLTSSASTTATASSSPGPKSSSNTTTSIIGAVVGVSVLIAVLGLSALFYLRRRRTRKKLAPGYDWNKVDLTAGEIMPFTPPYDAQEGFIGSRYDPAGTAQGSPGRYHRLPSTPYMDAHSPGDRSKFSMGDTTPARQSGYPMSDATTSTSTTVAYGTVAGVYTDSVVPRNSSTYSTIGSFSDTQVNYPVDAALLAGGEAGASALGMPAAGAPPNVPPEPRKGDLPVPVPRGSVYQHADLADDIEEIELPPAYKNRTGGSQ
ncbi:hypothetical protein BU17DRAFT_65803 [Hysterangium stoloniferum]|nr:hypothetical protein BU17DRAFT_65803 [Hysterangium stoloniferum]